MADLKEEEGYYEEASFKPKTPIANVEGYGSPSGGEGDGETGLLEGNNGSPDFKPVPFESEGAGAKYAAKQE